MRLSTNRCIAETLVPHTSHTSRGFCQDLISATSRNRSVAASQVSECSSSWVSGLGWLPRAISRQRLNSSLSLESVEEWDAVVHIDK